MRRIPEIGTSAARHKPCDRCGSTGLVWTVIAGGPIGRSWRLFNADGTAHMCAAGATGAYTTHTTTDTESVETDSGETVTEQPTGASPAEVARIHGLKRPALRTEYIARFPEDRTRSQYLPMDAMRDALITGQRAPDSAASNAPTVNVSPAGDGSDAATLAALIQRVAAGAMDERRVTEIAKREAEKAAKGIQPTNIVIRVADRPAVTIEGTAHALFPTLCTMVSAGVHVFIPGPAGSGKTHAGKQVATALGLDWYPFSCGPTRREHDYMGFIGADGKTYMRGSIRRAFENGGLFMFDEIDTSHAGGLVVINSALANGEAMFPDGLVQRHPDFRVIAAGNTYGTGPTAGFVGRQRLDAATLDRFAYLPWDYDRALETNIAKAYGPIGMEWAGYVWKVRDAITSGRVEHVAGTRAIQQGATLMNAGMDRKQAANAALWKACSVDARARIESLVGRWA